MFHAHGKINLRHNVSFTADISFRSIVIHNEFSSYREKRFLDSEVLLKTIQRKGRVDGRGRVTDKRKILVADSDASSVQFLSELVAGAGYETVVVASGKEALDVLSREAVDLAILSDSVAEIELVTALAALKTRRPRGSMRIVVVVQAEDPKTRTEALIAGADDFILKPIQRKEVLRTLQTQMELARLPSVDQGADDRRHEEASHGADEDKKTYEREPQSPRGSTLGAFEQLTRGIAHDMNNILGAIVSCANAVRDSLDSESENEIDELLRAVDHATGLTKRLLSSSEKPPSLTPAIDINRRLIELRSLLSRIAGNRVNLCVTPATVPALISIDPVQFDQLIMNLVLNARDAMPEGGLLHVALTPYPEDADDSSLPTHARLTVTDTGIGMSSEVKQRIFEPYFTTKASGLGSGLGLANCWSIISNAQGSVEVDSAPGQGTRFTVDLPLCAGLSDNTNVETSLRPGHSNAILLIVEQETELQVETRRILEEAGFEVHVASDGREAIQKLNRLGSQLDLLYCNVALPDCTGYDVAEYAARVAPQAPSLLTSGYVDEKIRAQSVRKLPILWKPVSAPKLVDAIKRALSVQQPADVGRAFDVFETLSTELVLVVTSDATVRDAFVSALILGGYATEVADSVAGAKAILQRGTLPRFIICDEALPDAPGSSLVDWISLKHPDIEPNIFVLAEGPADTPELDSITHRRNLWLEKPVETEQLLARLAQVRLSQTRDLSQTGSLRPHPPRRTLPPVAPLGAGRRRERVLFLEDNVAFASATERILSNAGFEVFGADSIKAARSLLDANDLDLMVADLSLPDGNAIDLIEDLRQQHIEIPVVVITGLPTVESATSAVRVRANEYLAKPVAPDELIEAANRALEFGRIARLQCQLLSAHSGGDEFLRNVGKTETLLTSALSKIRMVYQPIVRASDSSVYGYEALLRCEEPTLASPLRLFAAAEVLGRVKEVGRAVRAAIASTVLQRNDCVEAIFVNVHPSEFHVEVLAEAADPLLMVARRVVLEVTERASLEPGPKLADTVARIRGLGYRLAVDDLGEGYAGLSSLVHLQPDIAKIDMSLVRNIDREPLKRNIVAALVDLARRSGIAVVAEGVETLEERATLINLGCDLLQGYLISKPAAPFPSPRTKFESEDAPSAAHAESVAT